MFTFIADGVAILLSVAIAAIGVRFLLTPRTAAIGHGVPDRAAARPPKS